MAWLHAISIIIIKKNHITFKDVYSWRWHFLRYPRYQDHVLWNPRAVYPNNQSRITIIFLAEDGYLHFLPSKICECLYFLTRTLGFLLVLLLLNLMISNSLWKPLSSNFVLTKTMHFEINKMWQRMSNTNTMFLLIVIYAAFLSFLLYQYFCL